MANLLQGTNQRSADVNVGKVDVVSRPSRKTVDEVHCIWIPAALFGASLAQDDIQRVSLPSSEDSQYYRGQNKRDQYEKRRGQARKIPAPDTAFDPNMQRMKDDCDHQGQKDGR